MDSEFSEIIKNHKAQYLPKASIELVSFDSKSFEDYKEKLSDVDSFVSFEADDKKYVVLELDQDNFLEVSSDSNVYNTGILATSAKKLRKNFWDMKELADSNAEFFKTLDSVSKKEKEADDQGVVSESAMIHNSLFPSMETYRASYQQAEVFFEPYETPGGDFYWAKDYQHLSVAIVGDCTGHGMQGAMIAMSVMTLLKRVFRLPPISLKKSVEEFYEIFGEIMEEEKLSVFDVELGIVLLDKRSSKIQYFGSGVNFIHKNGVSSELVTSRKAKVLSGKQEGKTIECKKGDQLFLFSDGLTDQFDKDNKRKLGSKQLMEMISEMEGPITKSAFLQEFDQFRGDTSSLDDQTLLILTV